MGKIKINNMKFYTYNGVFAAEKQMGQPLEVDMILDVDIQKAGQSDDVVDTVNYAEVYEVISNILNQKQFDLIEAVAYHILQVIGEQFSDKVSAAEIHVRKYSVPMPGIYDNVEIELREVYQ